MAGRIDCMLSGISRVALGAAFSLALLAAPAAAGETKSFDIPAQEAATAIRAFGQQADLQVLATVDDLGGKRLNAVNGDLDTHDALRRLLAGTGLTFRATDANTILIEKPRAAAAPAGERKVAQADAEPSPAPADAAPAAEEEARSSNTVERVVVTGTRLKRTNQTTPVPTQIVDAEDIEASGQTDLGEILTEIPGVDFGLSPEGTHTDTQNAGLSVVSLRNLGSNRTLTLIDGRRAVSNSANAQRVSLSTIPSGFIDRVEVTTGGASAVYGADAVAGVVNVILKRNYEGFNVSTRVGGAQDGGEDEVTVEGTWGRNFADGRANVMAYLSYENEEPVRSVERAFAIRPLEFDAGALVSDLSNLIPGGRFEANDAWNDETGWHNDTNLPPPEGGAPRDFVTELDGHNLREQQWVSPARERWLGALKAHYELTPTLRAFTTVQYAWENTVSEREAQTVTSATSFGPFDNLQTVGSMAANHPFIPPEVEATRVGTVTWARRFSELGPDTRMSDRETTRMWAGFDGTIFGDWDWEAFVGRGKFTQDQTRIGEVNLENLRFGLSIEADPGDPGGFRCVDAVARANGCVPINLFGIGSLTPEMVDYIRAIDHTHTEIAQTNAAANLRGDLFDLPAGPVQLALGAEYRKEEQDTIGDPVTQTEVTGYAFIASVSGQYEVSEAFAEVGVPILADVPFFHSLDAEGAVRVASYSQENVGTVNSWKLGMNWAPIPDIRFRGQLSRAQRAPDITELFSPERGDFDTVSDPCDGVTLASTGTIADNCLAEPGILAEVQANGLFELDDTSVFAPNSGNLDLEEETSKTTTFGVVFTPRFLPDFLMIVDFYDIKIDDAIASIESDTLLDLCYASTNFPNNSFCDAVARNPLDGEITRIFNLAENLNQRRAKGIDATVAYGIENPIGIPGDFDFRVIYSYIDALDTTFLGPTGALVTENEAGGVGASKHQGRGTVTWTDGPWRVRWTTKYVGAAADDINLPKSDAAYLRVDEWMRSDLYVQYTLKDDDGSRTRLFAGVNNIFHDYGPYLPSGTNSGGQRGYNSAYDTIGRHFYAGVRVSW